MVRNQRIFSHPRATLAVWYRGGLLPTAGELCAYLWGPGDPAGWHLKGDGDAAWSPYWTRLTAQGGTDAVLDVQVASVGSDGALVSSSPWDREAGGALIHGRLRDLAVAHRARFRRVLARGYDTLAMVEARGSEVTPVESLALAAACEIGRVTEGMVVDGARNVGSAETIASRHHMRETLVEWVAPRAGQSLRADADDILTVQCRLLRVPFGQQSHADSGDLLDLSPRVRLFALAPSPSDETMGVLSPRPTITQGRLVRQTSAGLYQGSLDGRRCAQGEGYELCIEPDDALAGVRNASFSGIFTHD